MSGFDDVNVLRKILNIIPGINKPVTIQGLTKWRDDFSGNSLSSDNWEILSTGSGQSIQVSNSELRVSSGITANAQTIIRSKKVITLPSRIFFIYSLTQRIVNQGFHLELVDSSGNNFVKFSLGGTSATLATGESANNGFSTSPLSITIANSINYSLLEFDIGIEDVKITTKAVDSVSTRTLAYIRNRKIPDPSVNYFIQIRAVNSSVAAASNTDLFLDSVSYQSYQQINADLNTSRSSTSIVESVPVIITQQSAGSSAVSIADGGGFATLSTSNLLANGIFTSVATLSTSRNSVGVTVRTDQPGTLFFEQTPDGITWLDYGSKACVSGANTFQFTLDLSQFRFRYANGSNATTNFAIYIKTRT